MHATNTFSVVGVCAEVITYHHNDSLARLLPSLYHKKNRERGSMRCEKALKHKILIQISQLHDFYLLLDVPRGFTRCSMESIFFLSAWVLSVAA